jgi:hypothetical protein
MLYAVSRGLNDELKIKIAGPRKRIVWYTRRGGK